MAENIFTGLTKDDNEVGHRGEQINAPLPEWMKVGAILDDKEALLAHCEQHGVTLAILQRGFAQSRIDWRATTRPNDSDEKPISIKAHSEEARRRAQEFKIEPYNRPKKSMPKEEQAYQLLREAGYTEAQIEQLKKMQKEV